VVNSEKIAAFGSSPISVGAAEGCDLLIFSFPHRLSPGLERRFEQVSDIIPCGSEPAREER